jgi:hypothetical protein
MNWEYRNTAAHTVYSKLHLHMMQCRDSEHELTYLTEKKQSHL